MNVVLVRTAGPGVSSVLLMVTLPVTIREQQAYRLAPPHLTLARLQCIWTGLLVLCPSTGSPLVH